MNSGPGARSSRARTQATSQAKISCSTAGLSRRSYEPAAALPAQPDAAESHRRCRLTRLDHRNAERLLERVAIPGHTGTAHDDRVGLALVAETPADLDHARER